MQIVPNSSKINKLKIGAFMCFLSPISEMSKTAILHHQESLRYFRRSQNCLREFPCNAWSCLGFWRLAATTSAMYYEHLNSQFLDPHLLGGLATPNQVPVNQDHHSILRNKFCILFVYYVHIVFENSNQSRTPVFLLWINLDVNSCSSNR
jgi:hypothetical protein